MLNLLLIQTTKNNFLDTTQTHDRAGPELRWQTAGDILTDSGVY